MNLRQQILVAPQNNTLPAMMRSGSSGHAMTKTRDKAVKPGSVRIIGGLWRRRRLDVPAGVDVRPTPDRVRETLFNWLAPELPGARCLDLFAGSGALGLEALSRGAGAAVLVEQDARAFDAMRRNCATLGARAELVHGNAAAYLRQGKTGPFDVVFVDPPYAAPVDDVLAALPALLRDGARVYLERARTDHWPDTPGYEWLKRQTAGAVAFGLARFRTAGFVPGAGPEYNPDRE